MKRPEESPSESKAHLVVKLAFLLQWLVFLLSLLTCVAPFWYIELNTGITIGLWGRCEADINNCIWFNERDYAWERSLSAWHLAAQVLYAIALGILTISCIMAVGNLMFGCCILKDGTCPIIFGIMIAVAMLFETFSIATFGIAAYHEAEVSLHSWVAHFEWAFFIGIATIFGCLFASLTYLFSGFAIREDYKGYTAAPYGYPM